MIRGYKDLIRVLKQDGEDKKVEFTAYLVLSCYYDKLFDNSSSCDMKRNFEELISGVLLGLRFTGYINEKVFHLLKDELRSFVY